MQRLAVIGCASINAAFLIDKLSVYHPALEALGMIANITIFAVALQILESRKAK